ncbi:MAG: hypothetical protein B6U76_01005 [Desulfurococcales archaeon ex4484_217_2]|nr:MAG: hypothetical protein B6U76_01005 [Desulfurococcales archaeon ex4484_217_2]
MRRWLALLVIVAAVAVAAAAKPAAAWSPNEALDSARKALEGGWNAFMGWINDFILKPLGDAVRNIINGISSAVSNAFKSIIGGLTAIITYPVHILMQAWNWALTSLKTVLGPFGFMAPVILVLIFAAVALVIWYLLKIILPVI